MVDQNDSEFWDRLKVRMKEYSDAEIMDILRKIRLYEPPAQRMAIDEGIRRKLIHSEQDLYSESFRTPKLRFSFFPSPERKETVVRILRSMSRALLIAGVIPVIFGILKFQVVKYSEGSALILTGLIWITSAWMVYSRQDHRYWSPLLIIALLSAAYVARILLLLKGLRTMDYVIPGILFLVVFYCLFYLRFLLRKIRAH
jgi:hypothetical protein